MSSQQFRWGILIVFSVLGLAGLVPDAVIAQSCAMCKTYLSANDPLSRGINWSILFMLTTPYLIFGSVAGWVVYSYRRRSRRVTPSV